VKPEPPLRVGATVWPGYECLFLARTLGKFNHTPIRLVEYPGTPDVVRSFQNGSIEAAAMTSDEFLRLTACDPDARAILVMDYSNGADAVLANPGIHSVAELKGHRVAVEVNALGSFLIARALERAGVDPKEVEIVPTENENHCKALQSGVADAVVTFEPHRSRLLSRGAHVIFDSSQIPGEISDLLVVHQSLIESRPDTIRHLVRSWFESAQYLSANPRRACESMAKREHVSAYDFAASLKLIEIPRQEENLEFFKDNARAGCAKLEQIHKQMSRAGIVGGPAPMAALLDGRFLQ
jgi:NitT/TauT family transport system substrate-binding protein